ncbi:I78 family peptidase inhibitor [Tahibacter caeni]|uniref:I78 family peptidase inhibitor n=1 Tax=Tahibacter caeni TaxID=1453545 RepID=UPI0021499180|nr:I78 family peptidase inhibitor [Tahibacter caeni]
MTQKPLAAAAVLLAVFSLAACQGAKPQAGTKPVSEACRPGAAEALAGKDRIDDAQTRKSTGASIVRQIQPGQAVTMDYRRERVTIETDPETGKIERAFCG